MKRVFIVHQWGGSPSTDWYPLLKDELVTRNFGVSVPELPESGNPQIKPWVEKLREAVGVPDSETFFVAHSIGCQTVMRYLESIGEVVGGAVFVAPWLHLMNLENEESERIAQSWLETPIDFQRVRAQLPKLTAIFSSNDPFVPLADAEDFKEKLGAQIITLKNRGHFTEDDGCHELPEALNALLKMMQRA